MALYQCLSTCAYCQSTGAYPFQRWATRRVYSEVYLSVAVFSTDFVFSGWWLAWCRSEELDVTSAMWGCCLFSVREPHCMLARMHLWNPTVLKYFYNMVCRCPCTDTALYIENKLTEWNTHAFTLWYSFVYHVFMMNKKNLKYRYVSECDCIFLEYTKCDCIFLECCKDYGITLYNPQLNSHHNYNCFRLFLFY